jgi:hypothetical protein
MFKTLIRSVSLYGFDCLAINAIETEKLRRFDHVLIKQLFGLYKRSRAKIFMAAVGLNSICNQLRKQYLAVIQNLNAYDFTREIMIETQKRAIGKGIAKKCILSQLMLEAQMDSFDIEMLKKYFQKSYRQEEEDMQQPAQTKECQAIKKCLQNPSDTNHRTIQRMIYVDFKIKQSDKGLL